LGNVSHYDFSIKLLFKQKSFHQRKLLDFDEPQEPKDNAKSNETLKEPTRPLPGRAVLIENKVVEEKPFMTNDELPESELYFGGEKETETEHDLRMLKISQREEMARL
jgi:hypothetical protein